MKKVIGFLCLMASIAAQATADFQASVRFSEFLRLVSRTMLWDESAKAFVLAENEKLLGGGFGGTFLTMGSIRLSGLLREIENPMGYQAGSGVFREKTKISLAPSFQANTRTGLAISLFDENLSLYIIRKQNENAQAGVFCRFSIVPGMVQEVLLGMSMAPEEEEEDWFFNGLPNISGAMVTAAHRISFSGRDWRAGSDLVLSAPENAPVGWFGALFGGIMLAGTELQALLCFTSDDFATVSGVIQEDKFVVSLDEESALLSFLVLKLAYRKSVPHYVPVESAFYAGEESLSAALCIYPADPSISHPALKLEYSGKKAGGPLVFSRDGEACLVSTTLLAFDWMFLTVSAKIMRDVDAFSWSLDSSWEWKAAIFRGNISYAVEMDSGGISHSGTAALRLDAGCWSVFARMRTRVPVSTEDLFAFSFGADFTM